MIKISKTLRQLFKKTKKVILIDQRFIRSNLECAMLLDWMNKLGIKAFPYRLDGWVYLQTFSKSKNTGVINSMFPENMIKVIKEDGDHALIFIDPFIIQNEEIATKMKHLSISHCILDGHLPDLIKSWYENQSIVYYSLSGDDLRIWLLCSKIREVFGIFNKKRIFIDPNFDF